MNDHLHIVCLDAPSPPDYGGAIDMYNKIQSLALSGKKIILHYFDYKQDRNTSGLDVSCIEINKYKRKSFVPSFSVTAPYIITSRINTKLIKRLNKDNFPILLEGLHCTGIIPFIKDSSRIIIRMHNEERNYYEHLASAEKNFLKKIYFRWESKVIHSYQKKLKKDIQIAALSQTDVSSFENEYFFKNVHFIPCFISWQNVDIKEGRGSYCLYHGNIAISENAEAVNWLIENVFSKNEVQFVIAGKSVSEQLKSTIKNYKNISVVSNPSIIEINELIQMAHINVIPSMNKTGVKLKLLHSLLRGRYCITNFNGSMGSGITSGLHIAEDAQEFQQLIQHLMQKDFTEWDVQQRQQILNTYNNLENSKKLNALWKHYQ